MRAFFGLGKVESGTAGNYFFLMFEIVINEISEVENFRGSVDERKHYKSVGNLQIRMFIQSIEYNLRIRVFFEFDNDTHTVAVGFFAYVGNPLDFFVFDEVSHIFD